MSYLSEQQKLASKLWKTKHCRAPKYDGTWLLDEIGFANVHIRGKHYGTIQLTAVKTHVRNGTLCLANGALTYEEL